MQFCQGEYWGRIFTQLVESPCTIPCRTIHTKTKFMASVREKQDDFFKLRLLFNQIITNFTENDNKVPGCSSSLRWSSPPPTLSNPQSVVRSEVAVWHDDCSHNKRIISSDYRKPSYRVVLLAVPPNFQYQHEKRCEANQRFCSMKFSMYKRSLLVEQRFSF